jgi:hypothetical protein
MNDTGKRFVDIAWKDRDPAQMTRSFQYQMTDNDYGLLQLMAEERVQTMDEYLRELVRRDAEARMHEYAELNPSSAGCSHG